ncbi:MAG TPA: hypothetical protein VII52_03440 [Gemmatimonadaceae bacterium]
MGEPLERRVVATRNACVEALARRHGWTVPAADELLHLSPEMGVGDAWRRWMALNPPASAVVVAPREPGKPAVGAWVARAALAGAAVAGSVVGLWMILGAPEGLW